MLAFWLRWINKYLVRLLGAAPVIIQFSAFYKSTLVVSDPTSFQPLFLYCIKVCDRFGKTPETKYCYEHLLSIWLIRDMI